MRGDAPFASRMALRDGTNSFVWNARNQLVSMNATTISFAYDPFGRRVGKTIGGLTTNFLYDGLNPVQELSSGSPTASVLGGLGVDEHFLRADSAGSRNFLTDPLASTVALADSTGTVQTQYTYEPFGNTTVSGAASANPYQFTGRENDATGLYFYRARYYSPMFGRFVSQGPIACARRTNPYAYVGDAPTRFVDPLGLNKNDPMAHPSAAGLPNPSGPPSPAAPPPPHPPDPNDNENCTGQAWRAFENCTGLVGFVALGAYAACAIGCTVATGGLGAWPCIEACAYAALIAGSQGEVVGCTLIAVATYQQCRSSGP